MVNQRQNNQKNSILSSDSLLFILLSIFIPIVSICLSILLFYCCYYKRKSSHFLTLSSSSSTNTNVTNIHRHQIRGNSLYEIPLANIRFLEQIGEGKLLRFKYIFINFVSGEFGKMYVGELVDNKNKCIIKSLKNENIKHDYLREIESMKINFLIK